MSLDYATDQYVLKLVEREHILALSPHGTKELTYLRKTAVGIPMLQKDRDWMS